MLQCVNLSQLPEDVTMSAIWSYAIRRAQRRRRSGEAATRLRLFRRRPGTRPCVRESAESCWLASLPIHVTVHYAHPGQKTAPPDRLRAQHMRALHAASSLLPPFAQSLRIFFRSLPVLVFGNSSKTSTSRGTMKREMPLLFFAQSITSSPDS